MNPTIPLLLFAVAAAATASRAQAPAVLLRDIRPGTQGSAILGFAEMQGRLYFSARQSPFNTFDLWVTDGTPAGTSQLTQSTAVNVYNGVPVAVGPTLYFLGTTAAEGSEIWKSDGTAAGTRRVTDLNPGPTGAYADLLTSWGGYLWFLASAPATNPGLWRSDGTAAGTVQVLQIANLRQPTVAMGKLFFVGIDGAHGDELWVVDDPQSTPRMVLDIKPGSLGSNTGELIDWHGRVWFNADDGLHGNELWSSDGTAAGTALAADVVAGAGSSRPAIFTPTSHHLFFITADLGQTPYLWQTDGTQVGTVLVPNSQPLIGAAGRSAITAVGDVVYARVALTVASPVIDLWRTDGTAAGTFAVRGADPLQPLAPGHLHAVGSRYVYFEGSDSRGFELWRSDGTTAGTTLVADIVPGSGSSRPFFMQAIGGHLLVLASTPGTGDEPFTVPLDAHGQAIGAACGAAARATTLTATDPVLGQTAMLAGGDAYPGSVGLVFVGLPAPAPIAIGTGPCRCLLSLTGLTLLGIAPVNAPGNGSNWSLAVPIPNQAALQGLLLRAQAVFAPTDAALGFDLTNAANLHLGR